MIAVSYKTYNTISWILGVGWFLLCAGGGSFLIDYYIRLYPNVVGALLPLLFVLVLVVAVVGRSTFSWLLSKVLTWADTH